MLISFPLSLFVVATCLSPGPNNTLLLASGLNFGTGRSLPHLIGANLGFTSLAFLVGAGLGTALGSLPLLQDALRFLGALFLAFLAWKIATSAPVRPVDSPSRPLSFWQGFLFQWINPKAWVMITGAVSAYRFPEFSPLLQALMLALTFLILGFPCSAIWLLGGSGMQRFVANSRQLRALNLVLALLLAASIVPLLFNFES